MDNRRGDPRNIFSVIVDEDENDTYKSRVKSGMLKTRFSHNQFELCPQKLLNKWRKLYKGGIFTPAVTVE